MNRAKWDRPTVTMTHLATKLAEECGEVASEISDMAEMNFADERKLERLVEEAGHVIFIAGVILRRASEERSQL